MGKIDTQQYKSINTFKKYLFMHKSVKIGLIITLFFVGISGLWFINDIVGCLNLTMQSGGDMSSCGITNGFLFADWIKAFHIGLWTLEIVLALFTVLLIYYATRD